MAFWDKWVGGGNNTAAAGATDLDDRPGKAILPRQTIDINAPHLKEVNRNGHDEMHAGPTFLELATPYPLPDFSGDTWAPLGRDVAKRRVQDRLEERELVRMGVYSEDGPEITAPDPSGNKKTFISPGEFNGIFNPRAFMVNLGTLGYSAMVDRIEVQAEKLLKVGGRIDPSKRFAAAAVHWTSGFAIWGGAAFIGYEVVSLTTSPATTLMLGMATSTGSALYTQYLEDGPGKTFFSVLGKPAVLAKDCALAAGKKAFGYAAVAVAVCSFFRGSVSEGIGDVTSAVSWTAKTAWSFMPSKSDSTSQDTSNETGADTTKQTPQETGQRQEQGNQPEEGVAPPAAPLDPETEKLLKALEKDKAPVQNPDPSLPPTTSFIKKQGFEMAKQAVAATGNPSTLSFKITEEISPLKRPGTIAKGEIKINYASTQPTASKTSVASRGENYVAAALKEAAMPKQTIKA